MSTSPRKAAVTITGVDGELGMHPNSVAEILGERSSDDLLAEAVELIGSLNGFACARLCGTERHHDFCVRARDFLERMKGDE